MTLRAALHAYVREALDISVHDARLSLRPMMPAIVMQFISATTVQTMSNRRSLLPRRVQFDVYSNNDKTTDALATKLLLALDGYHGPMGDVNIGWATMLNDSDFPPEEAKNTATGNMEPRFRRSLDFEVAYQEATRLEVAPTSSS